MKLTARIYFKEKYQNSGSTSQSILKHLAEHGYDGDSFSGIEGSTDDIEYKIGITETIYSSLRRNKSVLTLRIKTKEETEKAKTELQRFLSVWLSINGDVLETKLDEAEESLLPNQQTLQEIT